jgi:hypothetical protein
LDTRSSISNSFFTNLTGAGREGRATVYNFLGTFSRA